jgi:ATP-dependent exoDNAse (exonuclease V) beta subunit
VYFALKKRVKDNFLIYNASAGSGKTYTLTKVYLKLILAPNAHNNFGHILALTFTNKAVNEMKERILTGLADFSLTPCPKKSEALFSDVVKELGCSREVLQKKSEKVLMQLLHNYAFFEVSTIDKFNHRLIRTFAKDLKLPQNFEVQLDTDLVLTEGVNALIDRAGNDAALTDILVAFALEKISEDKSWDLSFDLKNIGKLLFSDQHIAPLEHLSNKKLSDFENLKKTLKSKISQSEQVFMEAAKSIKTLLSESGLIPTDFSRQSLPKFIDKIISGALPDTTAKWIQEFEDTKLYTGKTPVEAQDTIMSIQPQLSGFMKVILLAISLQYFYRNAHKHLLSLRLINALQYQVKSYCENQEILPISEFNKKIQGAIKNQSVPFIYERMGEQYSHFFIDEFQDTSSLQWDNLKPLLENAVVSEDEKGQRGSLLLVGDAKQSIYRWRGGNAEQFIDLYENKALPAAQPKVINLPNNFRSLFEIVQFNNRFFNYTAAYLERENFASLYRDGSHQKPQKESGGFVSLEFLDDDPDKEAHYCEKVLDAINASLDKGFSFGDICLLTRKKKHGVLLAQYLIEKQIPVISSESLLLDNHPKVRFLVQLIRFVYQETTPYQAYPLLAYLAQTQNKISVHEYIKKSLGNASEFFKSEFGFNPEALNTASIYDFCLMGIRSFSLANGKDAYLQFFLDVVSEVSLKEGGGPSVLLQYWEQKKSQLSVSAPDGLNAIQILTVHKAKGLEFPVVIFPFAETPLKEERNPTFWLPVPKEDFDGFEYLLLAKNDKIAQYNPLSKQIIEEEDQRLVLDALNILYVALTRASQALFVIGGMALNKDGKVNKNQYSGLLIDYLMDQEEWSAEKQRYTFGHFKMPEETTAAHKNDPKTIFFQLTQNTHERYALLMHPHTFVPEKVLQAQNLGQQLHYLLEQLDIHPLEKSLEKTSKAYPSADLGSLKTQAVGIISHEHLEKYYQKGLKAFNEKDIFTQNGSVARPDRLVFNENKVTVIDYKTGVEKEEDQVQIKSYGALLEEMGYQVENKILVYVDGARVLPIFV